MKPLDWAETEKVNNGPPGPDFLVIRDDEIAEALGLLTTDAARTAFTMNVAGYSHAQIAEELGLTGEKAVENLLGHQRRRIAGRPSRRD